MSWPITDNFNRADADVLGAMSDGVHNWTELTGDIDIVANKAKAGGGANGNQLALVTEAHTETDYYVQALCFGASNADSGVAARCTDIDNFYVLRQYNATLELYKDVGGAYTLLASWAKTVGWHTVKLEVNGTTLNCYYDGVLQTWSPGTDSSLTSGKPGIRSYFGTDPSWDDFVADLLGAPPAPVAPPTLGLMGVGK